MTEACDTAYTIEEWISRHQQVCDYNLADFEAEEPVVPGYQCIYEMVSVLIASFHRGQYIVPLHNTLRVILTTLVFPEANNYYQLRNKCNYLLTKYLEVLETGSENEDGKAREAALLETFNATLKDFMQGIRSHLIDSFFSVVPKVMPEAPPPKPMEPDVICISDDESDRDVVKAVNKIVDVDVVIDDDDDDDVETSDGDVTIVENHPDTVDAEIKDLLNRRIKYEAELKLPSAKTPMNEPPPKNGTASPTKRKGKGPPLIEKKSKLWSRVKYNHGELLGRLQLVGERLLKAHSNYSFWDLVVWWGWVGHQCTKMQAYGHPNTIETWAYQYFDCYRQFINLIVRYLRLGHLPKLAEQLIQQLTTNRSQWAQRASEICFSGVDEKEMNPKPRGPYGHETNRVCQEFEEYHKKFVRFRPQTYTADIELVPTWYQLIVFLASHLSPDRWVKLVADRLKQCPSIISEEFFECVYETALKNDKLMPISENDTIYWLLRLSTQTLKLQLPKANVTEPVLTKLQMLALIEGDSPNNSTSKNLQNREVIYRFLVRVYKPNGIFDCKDKAQLDYYERIIGS